MFVAYLADICDKIICRIVTPAIVYSDYLAKGVHRLIYFRHLGSIFP